LCDERFARAQQKLAGYDVEFLHMKSLAAALTVPDGSLDFVYIDGDHRFDAIMLDLILWSRKVRPGGIVAGHDFFEFYKAGVTTAVRAYTQAHGITQWYVTKEKEASFLWVQP
ncbi:MAG: class I SAM-dependent methyltransferase, partial [Planctomycetes bacterium]|nr:class I SAM-dependent methyltransferase [Planctomycetota bacterium]